MKLDIEKLKALSAPETVVEFMVAHGTNHQLLLDAWKDPQYVTFKDHLPTLVLCLAFAIQQTPPKKAVVKRLRGRVSKVRYEQETLEFDMHLNPGMGFLK